MGSKPQKANCHHGTPMTTCHCGSHRGHALVSTGCLSSTLTVYRHVGDGPTACRGLAQCLMILLIPAHDHFYGFHTMPLWGPHTPVQSALEDTVLRAGASATNRARTPWTVRTSHSKVTTPLLAGHEKEEAGSRTGLFRPHQ